VNAGDRAGAAETDFHNGSLWFDGLGESPRPRQSSLPAQVDVAIVGGGYTGLWTAYYLKRAEPSLDVAVFEAEVAGFGASGRNGGWCVGEAWGVDALLADPDTVRRRTSIATTRVAAACGWRARHFMPTASGASWTVCTLSGSRKTTIAG
jgi:glycine/D-amino acid oxidase-like deaminating enzyme